MTESLRSLTARFLALFRRDRLDRDLDAELRSHLDMAIERNLKQGMSVEQARREAVLGFGGLEQTKQIYRERRGLPFFETALQDLRFGLRMLRRNPGFTVLVIYASRSASAPTPPYSAGSKAFFSGLIRSFRTRSVW